MITNEISEYLAIERPAVVETLEDVAQYANRAPGTGTMGTLRIDDLSLAISHIKDFETYLRLKLTIDIQSAQVRLWDIISPDVATHFKTRIAKSTWLQEQLKLPKEQRDPIAQIEIDGHETYFQKARNW